MSAEQKPRTSGRGAVTADLDLSPEAVERLASRCSGLSKMRGALQDDALSEASATLRALSAENARLRAERDVAWQAGAVAMREAAARTCILSAQDIAEGDWGPEGLDMAAMLKRWIGRRSLPIPDKDA